MFLIAVWTFVRKRSCVRGAVFVWPFPRPRSTAVADPILGVIGEGGDLNTAYQRAGDRSARGQKRGLGLGWLSSIMIAPAIVNFPDQKLSAADSFSNPENCRASIQALLRRRQASSGAISAGAGALGLRRVSTSVSLALVLVMWQGEENAIEKPTCPIGGVHKDGQSLRLVGAPNPARADTPLRLRQPLSEF